MMMEFRISDIVEKFRTLINYKQQVDYAAVDEAFALEKSWEDLLRKSKAKDVSLDKSKQ